MPRPCSNPLPLPSAARHSDFCQQQDGNGLSYLSGAFFADLATWYLLAWSGESLRRSGKVIPQLMAKGGNFSLADRQSLLGELSSAVAGLIPALSRPG
jgi:hypothetical protein